MINRSRLGAILAVTALGYAGGIVAREETDEEREARRKEPPPEPRAITPEKVVTAHDRERIRRAEMKRARKAAALSSHDTGSVNAGPGRTPDPSPPRLSQGA